MLRVRTVTDLLQTLSLRLPSLLPGRVPLTLSHRQWGVVAAAAAVMAGAACWAIFRRRTPPEEIERLRRVFLAKQGRITDAILIDSSSADAADAEGGTPSVLCYQYRIAGVTYECAQDVSLLADHVRRLRMDLPVQVRYDPHNPTNSIVVSEMWSGLRQG